MKSTMKEGLSSSTYLLSLVGSKEAKICHQHCSLNFTFHGLKMKNLKNQNKEQEQENA